MRRSPAEVPDRVGKAEGSNHTIRLVIATTDVNDAYRNVRIALDDAHNFYSTVGELIVVDFWSTFGWTGSSDNFRVVASAAEHSTATLT